MNDEKFFDEVRSSLFNGKLSQATVNSINAIIRQGVKQKLQKEYLAYILATVFHECGSNMQPIRESMNYSVSGLLNTFSRKRISKADAEKLGRKTGEKTVPLDRQQKIANILYGGEFGKTNLGNTEPNDGWNFRGGGLVQLTGRDNFKRASKYVNIDLVKVPDHINDLDVSVTVLVNAMIDGMFRVKRLTNYSKFPQDYYNMRDIINADKGVNGEKIAGYAVKFADALTKAGYNPDDVIIPDAPVNDIDDVVDVLPGHNTSKWNWLINIIEFILNLIFKRK